MEEKKKLRKGKIYMHQSPQWNPIGKFLEQALRIKARQMGISGISKPIMLALRAMQRQVAASKSTRPSRREQHGVVGGLPIVMLSSPPNNPPHALNVNALLTQVPFAKGDSREAAAV